MVVFAPVLGLPYAFDDLQVLDQAARYRSGAMSAAELLLRPHNEHVIPLYRLLVWGCTELFGLDTRPLRLVLLAFHVVGGWACALLVARHARNALAPFLAATVYGAAAYAGSVVWCPTCSVFLLFSVPVWLALALVGAGTLRPSTLGAVFALLLLASAGTSAAVPMLASVAAGLWLLPDRLPARRRLLLAAAAAALAVAVLLVARAVYADHSGRPFPALNVGAALRVAGMIVFHAPGKVALAALGRSGYHPVALTVAAACGWAVLLGGLALLSAGARRLLAACWVGPLALAAAIGFGRGAMYDREALVATDRYFYPFAGALAVHVALIAASLQWRTEGGRRRVFEVLAVLAALGFVAGARILLPATVPWPAFGNQATAWSRFGTLARLVAEEAPRRPGGWVLPDVRIPAHGIHLGSLPLRTVVYVFHPEGVAGVSFGRTRREDRVRLNETFRRWSRALGWVSPPLCIAPGGAEAAPASVVDFRLAPHDAVVSGFHAWEGAFRWMGAEAAVRLERGTGDLVLRAFALAGPLRGHDGVGAVRVDVLVDGRPVGGLVLDRDGGQEARFAAPAPAGRGSGGAVTVRLVGSPVWRPLDVLPGNRDRRELTAAVVALGFTPGSLAQPEAAPCPPR